MSPKPAQIDRASRGADTDPGPGELSPAETAALRRMLLIRTVEERLLALFSEGKLFGTTHTCIGQEVCAEAAVGALDLDRDVVFSTHRCHGHFLRYTDDPAALIAEVMGRQTGASGGRGGSQHLCVRNFYSNGVQGGIAPVAVGVALAERRKGSGAIAMCVIGDGTLGEGVLYEAFNLAALWKLPVLFLLEHNRYAQSTPTERTTAGDVEARAAAFGIPTDRRTADDPIALDAHLRDVVARVRGGGPFLQVLDTDRLMAHSKGDDDRSAEELAMQRARDPLAHMQRRAGDLAAAMQAEAEARVEAAVRAADTAPFAVVDAAAQEQAFESRGYHPAMTGGFAADAAGAERLVVQHLNLALHEMMEQREEVLLLGEDLADPYGGAFKVSRGLSVKFPQRVLSTPISEAAIIGAACGASVRGLRPIVEIMFGDFLALGADQILNHLSKFRWMYNDQVETPVVIRTPVGGRRGYGPTHSQCPEKMFLGIPGLVVVAISRRHDPGALLRRAVLDDPRPVLFLEQKILYAKRLAVEGPSGLVFEVHPAEAHAFYPTGIWRPAKARADVTVVTYGAMTDIAEEGIAAAFEEDEIAAEYVVPSQLAPLRIEPIVDSVRRTGRLVVVEEGTGPWGFGAEVVARVVEAMRDRPPSCARVAAHHLPIPNARPAEDAVLPDAARVRAAMRAVVGAAF